MSAHHSQRPDSRASTTSVTTQQDDSLLQSLSQDSKPVQLPFTTQGPEAALLQYQASIAPAPHMMQYSQAPMQNMGQRMALAHAQPHPHPLQMQQSAYDGSFLQQDLSQADLSQQDMAFVHMRMGSAPIPMAMDLHEEKRKKGSAVTATNDKELREMLSRNEGRPLKDVAQEVIQKERTPMAEKTKQLFAMLWLRAVCKPAKTSVPRNRVYSQYANRCGTERVVPLNPASFGKLVRVIFPGIQTRRLGVRGESKYHYVDLALGEEQITALQSSWQNLGQSMDGRQSAMSNHSNQLDFNNIPRLQADAGFSAVDTSFDTTGLFPSTPRGPASQSKTFVYPQSRGMQAGTAEASTYSRTLRFPSSNMPAFEGNDPVDLPSIQPYLPPRTDIDTAEALSALYRTHCISLIDSIRFCKEKQFFRLYMSFHGTLTVPVQKLFTHPNVAPWIEQCDLVMYRTMIRFVSRLTLQAAPVRVINTLSNISASLHDHIAKTFATHPTHVIEAKVKPATVFAGLLYRLIRVNQSAHAAANLLTIDQNREQMWHEWATMVNPKRVMEAELPDCGYEEVHRIMTTEMRNLLEPLQAPALQDDASLYSFDQDTNVFGSFLPTQNTQTRTGSSQVSTENVLDRWSTFLMSLPGRFPNASARTVLHCISAVGTAALRDITIMSGLSYGHWWVLKIFVDEMALWMAEMGGFLEPSGSGAPNAVVNGGGNVISAFQSPALDAGNNGTRSNTGSRLGSADHDQSARNPFTTDTTSSTQQTQQQQLQQYPSQNQHQLQQQQQQQQQMQQASRLQQQQQQRQQQQNANHDFVHQQQQQFQAALQQQQQQQSQQQQQQQFPTLHFASQPILTKQQPQQQQPEADIDDSGIGLSLMDDEDALQELSKFNASAAAASALGHVHHSHHALNALADMSC